MTGLEPRPRAMACACGTVDVGYGLAAGFRACPRCESTLCSTCEELHQCPDQRPDTPAPEGSAAELVAAAEENQRLRAWLEAIALDSRGDVAKGYASQALYSSAWPPRPTRSNPRPQSRGRK